MPAPPSVTPQDRLLRAFRALVREELPRLTFLGNCEYLVQPSSASDGTTVDLAPSDPSFGLPSLTKVPMRLSANVSAPQNGQRVIVIFINGDPTRPMVLSTDPVPTKATYDATSSMTLAASTTSTSLGGASGSSLALGSATASTASLSASSITVGSTATSVTVGPLPLPVATAAPVVSAFGALSTFLTLLSTTIQAMSSGYASLSTAQKTAFTAGVTTATAAIATASPLTPTTVLKAT